MATVFSYIFFLFEGDGKKLASVGLDDNHCIIVWDWRKGCKLAETRGHKDKIFMLQWNPAVPDHMITVGVKHIKFWTQVGKHHLQHDTQFHAELYSEIVFSKKC